MVNAIACQIKNKRSLYSKNCTTGFRDPIKACRPPFKTFHTLYLEYYSPTCHNCIANGVKIAFCSIAVNICKVFFWVYFLVSL